MEEIKPIASQPVEIKPKEVTPTKKMWVVLLVPIALGVLTGVSMYLKNNNGTVVVGGKNVEIVNTPTEEGVRDAATFPDTAIGILVENDGKITKEGTHILQRGDTSQNAYLVSSVIDLSKYVGKKVQVWGETFKGQEAGWLMNIGRIKLVN